MRGFQDVQDDIACMAQYWMRRKGEFVGPAGDEFMLYVDPMYFHEEHPSETKVQTVNAYFTEWVLFERVLRDGKTPLELFVIERPVAMPKKSWARLEQVVETQFFSRFAICRKDVARGVAVLRDVRTDETYEVLDEFLCGRSSWSTGTIAERIGRVEGGWTAIGQAQLYDVAAPEHTMVDGPGELHPEERDWLPEALHESFYLRMLHDTMGMGGRYTPSLRIPD